MNSTAQLQPSFAPLETPRRKGVSVILSEDHTLLRYGLLRFLEENQAASDGAQSSELTDTRAQLVETEQGVLMLDISLPGQNGWEVLAKLHDNPLVKPFILGATCYDRLS